MKRNIFGSNVSPFMRGVQVLCGIMALSYFVGMFFSSTQPLAPLPVVCLFAVLTILAGRPGTYRAVAIIVLQVFVGGALIYLGKLGSGEHTVDQTMVILAITVAPIAIAALAFRFGYRGTN